MNFDITLYHCPDWASTIIRLVLEDLELPHALIAIEPDAGDLASAAYRAVNPLGLVPAITTAEGPVFETAAILLWLVDRTGQFGPGPADPERAAFLSWLFFASNTLHVTVMDLIHPERPGGEASARAVQARAFEALNVQAAQLETLIGTRAPRWLAAEAPGVMGHYIGILLRWAAMLPEDPALRFDLRPYPALAAVLAAHEARPAALRVAAADGLGPSPFTAPGV